ncbi:lipoprotein LpqH [Mycolicibacterium celeriflavum]|uniref:lipoprotein LpqH n=1 Tax=Mycolicibacterium celeriflavum TaxID=1249101 RepID=UPI003CED4660
MRIRSSAVPVLAAAAVVSGCGLVGSTPSEEPAQSGRIVVDGNGLDTKSVECTQHEWSMQIDAKATTGSAQVFLELGGEKPVVRTVNIENVNEINGAAGGDAGKAEATTSGNVYTITGTVIGADGKNPGQTRTMPFQIKAPC